MLWAAPLRQPGQRDRPETVAEADVEEDEVADVLHADVLRGQAQIGTAGAALLVYNRRLHILLPASENDAGIYATEAEAIGDGVHHRQSPCCASHQIESLGGRIRVLQVESGGRDLVA